MTSGRSYRKKIFIYFFIIMAVFAISVIIFEQTQIKKERIKYLENIMDVYAESVHEFIKTNNLLHSSDISKVNSLLLYFPDELRLTVIDWNGKVIFDNTLTSEKMENHLQRKEIQKAIVNQTGYDIRVSKTTKIKYIYYAKRFTDLYFVRIALPFDERVVSILKSGNSFLVFILLFFIVSALLMKFFANQFSKSLQDLRIFSQRLKNGEIINEPVAFRDDEVGEISAVIVDNYNQLQENRKQTALEREKLLQHFHYSEEGIALFSKDKTEVYVNSHIIQFLNVIFDKPVINIEDIFSKPKFSQIVHFLDSKPRSMNVFTQLFENNGKKFSARVIVFDDESFELYISDITKAEKTRLLKQEMTNNIAHELRTPVTSIRGYIETIFNLKDDDAQRRNSFLERAYAQTMGLSELIQDISLLTKIEEASDRFAREEVDMKEILEEVKSDLEDNFEEKGSSFLIEIPENNFVEGNRTLLYSIFRNLAENSLAYAGEEIQVVVRWLNINDGSNHFEFYDNGVGVEEKHLVRIFERFYRVNEGRTRNTGGSGLGLSIVKNAMLFHQGNIVAKNRPEGGLSFILTFPKR